MKMIYLKNFFLKFRLKIYLFLLILLLVFQFLFWKKLVNIRAFLDVVDTPPSENTLRAFSFGDEEYYYRVKTFKVQNMGDTYGRFTSLLKYDYKKLYDWFMLLEKLDQKSNYLPSLVAYYYSVVPDVKKKSYTVEFLKHHNSLNPDKNWWWLYQAMYIAFYGMKDDKLGMDLAYLLKETSPASAPIWTKQMVAILQVQLGNECEAIRIINEVLKDYDNETNKEKKDNEINYMKYFLTTNIKMLEEKKFDVQKCLINTNLKNDLSNGGQNGN